MAFTWQDAIDDIEREINAEDIWDASVSDNTQKTSMRDFLFRALLVASQDLPLARLPDPTTAALSFSSEGTIESAALPSDLFESRDDLGVVQIMLNNNPRNFSEQVPLSSVTSLASNQYASNVLFYLDETIKTIYAANIDGMKTNEIKYVALPSKPTVADLDTTNLNFDEAVIESAVQVVASHLSGVPLGSMDEMKVHQILGRMYLGGKENG